MSEDKDASKIVTGPHTAAYTNLFEPNTYKDKKTGAEGKPTYGYLGLFKEVDDYKKIVDLAQAIARKEWGDDVDMKTVEMPFKNAAKEADRLVKENGKSEAQVAFYRQYRGLVKVSTQFKPQVVDKKGEDILDRNEIYSGVVIRAELNLVPRQVRNNKFIKAYVNFVMKVGDGQRLAGRDAKSVFKGIMGETSNTDVADDDITEY